MKSIEPFDMHQVANAIPQVRRGKVWCARCGREASVDGARALANGWPTCCGETMTIDSPEERAARRKA